MKRIYAGLLALLLVLSLTGCGTEQTSATVQGAYDNEILTTTAVDQDKTMITVRVENSVAQTGTFETLMEETFPNVDFVLVHDGSINSEYTIRADLVSGTACDLILSRRLNTVDDIAADYLLDLSAESFVDNYYVNAVNSCATSEGKLYYLPGPSDVYGIVYDKTMFEENGWQLPHSYSEFVELLNTIREANLTSTYVDSDGNTKTETVVPIQPSMMYPDMFQIVFNTYGYESTFGGTSNYQWLTNYQNGEGSLVGHAETAVQKFKQLFTDGILSLNDWDVQPSTRSAMMYTYHTTAMIIECQNAVGYAESYAENSGDPEGTLHEIAMMPFWTSDNSNSDYVYSIPSFYMAINKASAEESAEKKALLLEIYSFLSSAEGQELLIDGGAQISSVKGVTAGDSAFAEAIQNTVSSGRIVSNFYLAAGENSKQVEKQLRSTAPDMIQGTMSVKDWLLAADQVRDEFLAGTDSEETVYGQVETTLTRLESAYTMAEMYKDLTGADIGIAYGGAWRRGTNGHFYAGDITDSSLACVTPYKEASTDEDPEWTGSIVTSTLTGQQILDILNNATGLTSGGTAEGEARYYVAAGLTVKFDPWAAEGSRVLSCKLPSGEDIEPEGTYRVAYFYGSLPDGSLPDGSLPDGSLGEPWLDSFITWLDQQGGVIKQPSMTIELAYGQG
jgi:ABC-type glycerol-3-phosphate transport system substrate-binding protein